LTAGLLCALLLLALPAFAAEWGAIVPGVSTTDHVRTRHGAPTKSEKLKVEGYDTEQWTYDGARAPAGLRRMIVDFGLLQPDGYKPAVVRTLRLEPKPGVFARRWVLLGWGLPDGDTTIEGVPTFFYHSGLIVYFDKDMANAATMVFTVPQQPAPGKAGR
jgi:hypothetical protein